MQNRMANPPERSSFALNFGNARCLSRPLQDFFGRAASIASQAASGSNSRSLNSPAPRSHCAPSITTHSPLMYSAMSLMRNAARLASSSCRPKRFIGCLSLTFLVLKKHLPQRKLYAALTIRANDPPPLNVHLKCVRGDVTLLHPDYP